LMASNNNTSEAKSPGKEVRQRTIFVNISYNLLASTHFEQTLTTRKEERNA
jgi:hypothetical protein